MSKYGTVSFRLVLYPGLVWCQPIFLSAQAIVPAMIEQGSGIFINITRCDNQKIRSKRTFLQQWRLAQAVRAQDLALPSTMHQKRLSA
jgi:hypothetical protein